MIYEVTPDLKNIDFGATGTKEILQNVAMILATMVYSCPMDRAFSLDPALDAPINIVMARMTATIFSAVQTYEPRVEIKEVSFDGDGLNGVLIPKVKLVIV